MRQSLFLEYDVLVLGGIQNRSIYGNKNREKTWTIGLCSWVLPLLFSIFSAFVLRQILSPETDLYKSLFYIAVFLSSGSYHVTASLLEDLKLLNSEVGQLALSSSMVSGVVSAVWETIIITRQQTTVWKQRQLFQIYDNFLGGFIVFHLLCSSSNHVLDDTKRIPEGKPIKESYIISTLVMMLGCSLASEFIGPVILGWQCQKAHLSDQHW